jgi:hypothetical protein
MTMTALELEMEVAEIKTRLVEVERVVREQLGGLDVVSPPAKLPVSNAELLDWLRQQGLVREPTPDERCVADTWNQRTEEEKQAVLWELEHLPPGPMASDIIRIIGWSPAHSPPKSWLLSIHLSMAAHTDQNDLVFPQFQLQRNAVLDVDRDRVQSGQATFERV